jgi:hypothetical protein
LIIFTENYEENLEEYERMEVTGMDNQQMYEIRRTNLFDDNLMEEYVGAFANLELAKAFVEWQAVCGNSYAIVHDGKRIDF